MEIAVVIYQKSAMSSPQLLLAFTIVSHGIMEHVLV